MRAWPAVLLVLSGCGSSAGATAPVGSAGAAGSAAVGEVEVGVPGGMDGLDFNSFADGSELGLHTFGQGGVHVLLAVRCIGFGSRAFVAVKVTNQNSGTEVIAPAPSRPQLLFCDGEVCDLVPITMIVSGLTQSDAERDGLPVQVSAEVHNAAGVSGRDSLFARLSTADL